MRAPKLALFSLLLVTLALYGCGGAATSLTPVTGVQVPTSVTESNFDEARRAFYHLRLDDSSRVSLRGQLVAVLHSRTAHLAESSDYAVLVDHFWQFTQLYTPEEIAQGSLAIELGIVADLLVERGSPRGDEGRVLSALLVQRLHHADDPAHQEAYEKLVAWGKVSRMGLVGMGPLEDFEGLVTAWEEHVRLTPTPDTMNALAKLYVDQREALIALFQQSERQMPLSSMVMQRVQGTVFNVAAVFLANGDLAGAHRQVTALAHGDGIERSLARSIELALEDSNAGSGATLDLARSYLQIGRTDVGLGLCRYGLRRVSNDPRFHQCLAQIAAVGGDYAGAMAWYAEAVALAPDERALYDEILEVLSNLIEQGLMDTDPSSSRRLGARALEILQQRAERWPDSPTSISTADLYLAIGVAEMNAGNAADAESRLRESLAADNSVKALTQLGLLLARVNRNDEAIEIVQRALELTPAGNPNQTRERAQLMEQLGDAQRAGGHTDKAARSYAEALELWNMILPNLRGPAGGVSQARRGVLFARLDRHDEALVAFEQGMTQAPGIRDVYATILTYLVTSGTDHALANQVLRRAQVQMDLAPEWKVYFSLWARANATQQGLSDDADAGVVLSDLAGGEGWWGRLARFGAGTLSYAQLLQEASSVGERAEAHFYGAMRLLAAGKKGEADALLREVIATRMVSFYEYAMAAELLASGATTVTTVTTTTSDSAPATTAATTTPSSTNHN